MRLIGRRPPKTWPIKVFWILVFIHLPMIALIIVTNMVHGTVLNMIEFWLITVPIYFLSLLLDPLRFCSAVIAVYLIWYSLQFDWTPFFNFLFGSNGGSDNFIRGRRLMGPDDFRSKLSSRRMTLNGRRSSDPRIKHQ